MDNPLRNIHGPNPQQNPRHSITCPSCGAAIDLDTVGGTLITQPTPPAFEPYRTASLPPAARPRVIMWIVFFSVLSALWGLWYSDLWTTMPSHDRFHVFTRFSAFINFPLDSLLLVSSIALLTEHRAWGRRWMIVWSIAAFLFQTFSLLVIAFWIAPTSTMQDLTADVQQLVQFMGGTPDDSIALDACCAWLSILFLSSWIYWTLTRKKIMAYFEPNHAAHPTNIS